MQRTRTPRGARVSGHRRRRYRLDTDPRGLRVGGPYTIVVNKADIADPDVVDRILRHEKHAIAVSARSGAGIAELIDLVAEELPRPSVAIEAIVPYARGDLMSRIHESGEIAATEHRPEGTYVVARVGADLAADLAPFAQAS